MRLPPSTLRSAALAAACFALLLFITWLVLQGIDSGGLPSALGVALAYALGFFPALIDPRRVLLGVPVLALVMLVIGFMDNSPGGAVVLLLIVIGGPICFVGALVGALGRALYDRARPPAPAPGAQVFD